MRHFAIALALVLAIAGCGGGDRPDRSEWRADWDATKELVPTVEAIEGGGEDVCGDVLGEVRAQREVLLPTPFETVDSAVDEWVALVEGIGLDCPDDAEELDQRVAEIESLTAEIDRRTGVDR